MRHVATAAILVVAGCSSFGVDHPAGDDPSDASIAEGGAVDAGADAGAEAGAGADAGAVALVQETTARGSNTRSLVVTLSADAANGDMLVLAVALNGPTSMSALAGGAPWTRQAHSCGHVCVEVWTGLVSAGVPSARATVAMTFPSDATAVAVHLSEWRGIAAVGAGTVMKGDGDPITTAPLVVTEAEATALLFTAVGGHNVTVGMPTNGFVPLPAVAIGDLQLLTAYKLEPPAGSHTASWAHPTIDGWDALLLSFSR
jgi:hypothetical protein